MVVKDFLDYKKWQKLKPQIERMGPRDQVKILKQVLLQTKDKRVQKEALEMLEKSELALKNLGTRGGGPGFFDDQPVNLEAMFQPSKGGFNLEETVDREAPSKPKEDSDIKYDRGEYASKGYFDKGYFSEKYGGEKIPEAEVELSKSESVLDVSDDSDRIKYKRRGHEEEDEDESGSDY